MISCNSSRTSKCDSMKQINCMIASTLGPYFLIQFVHSQTAEEPFFGWTQWITCIILISQRAHIFEISYVFEHKLIGRSQTVVSPQMVDLLPKSISLITKRLLRPILRKTPITRFIKSAISIYSVICREQFITTNHLNR